MQIKKIESTYKVHSSLETIDDVSRQLLQKAKDACERAYANYSNFKVGAALLMEDGEIIEGNNQENAAYPSGMCAERVAVFYASSKYPHKKIKAIAITAQSKLHFAGLPVTPCGACRQVMSEFEVKQQENIRLFLSGESKEVWELESAAQLLPLSFGADRLKPI